MSTRPSSVAKASKMQHKLYLQTSSGEDLSFCLSLPSTPGSANAALASPQRDASSGALQSNHRHPRRVKSTLKDITMKQAFFEVTMIDCTAPPESRRQKRALVIDLPQRSIHCFERKQVKAIISISDIVRLEVSPTNDCRLTLFSKGEEKRKNMNMGLKYWCEFLFSNHDKLDEFCMVAWKCHQKVEVCIGKAGKPAWIPDSQAKYCMLESCQKPFSVTVRRHHCRRCGFLVCNACSDQTAVLPEIGSKPVRVCDVCVRDTLQIRVSNLGTTSALEIQDGGQLVRRNNLFGKKEKKEIHSKSQTKSTKRVTDQMNTKTDLGEEEYDVYGFPLKEGNCHILPEWETYLHAQRKRWSTYLSHNTTFSFDTKDLEVKNLVRRGIPPELRGHLWPLLCGSERTKNAMGKGYYGRMVSKAQNDSAALVKEQIEKDLARTFPDHQGFEAGDSQAMLRRVLEAFAMHNPDVGYCQSMNFICAVLLLFMEEEDAFWVFVTVIEDVCRVTPDRRYEFKSPSDSIIYHQPDLAGILIDQNVFQDLVQKYLPKLSSHLEAIDMRLDAVTTNWFMCIFTTTLPIELTLHIWDCMFYEGTKILFRAGLAILKNTEKQLLACESFEEVLYFLRNLPKYEIDIERFMKTCFDSRWISKFSKTRLARLRTQHIQTLYPDLLVPVKARRKDSAKARKRDSMFRRLPPEKQPISNTSKDARDAKDADVPVLQTHEAAADAANTNTKQSSNNTSNEKNADTVEGGRASTETPGDPTEISLSLKETLDGTRDQGATGNLAGNTDAMDNADNDSASGESDSLESPATRQVRDSKAVNDTYLQMTNKIALVGEDKTIHFDPKYRKRYKTLSWHILSKVPQPGNISARRFVPPPPPPHRRGSKPPPPKTTPPNHNHAFQPRRPRGPRSCHRTPPAPRPPPDKPNRGRVLPPPPPPRRSSNISTGARMSEVSRLSLEATSNQRADAIHVDEAGKVASSRSSEDGDVVVEGGFVQVEVD